MTDDQRAMTWGFLILGLFLLVSGLATGDGYTFGLGCYALTAFVGTVLWHRRRASKDAG